MFQIIVWLILAIVAILLVKKYFHLIMPMSESKREKINKINELDEQLEEIDLQKEIDSKQRKIDKLLK